MRYAYHIMPEKMIGDYIVPISQLWETHPGAAAKASLKYTGREFVRSKIVYDPRDYDSKHLGHREITWDMVSFWTLHNPQIVRDWMFDCGWRSQKGTIAVAKVPINRFKEHCSTVWLFPDDGQDTQQKLDPSSCISVSDAIKDVDTRKIPDASRQYLQQSIKSNKKFFTFVYIPHLLCTEPIKVIDCEVFEI